MQQPGQPQSPLMSGAAAASAMAAFVLAFIATPDIYAQSKGYAVNHIIQNYGYEYTTWGEIGWGIVCALLVFALINFMLQALVTVLAIILAKIFI